MKSTTELCFVIFLESTASKLHFPKIPNVMKIRLTGHSDFLCCKKKKKKKSMSIQTSIYKGCKCIVFVNTKIPDPDFISVLWRK